MKARTRTVQPQRAEGKVFISIWTDPVVKRALKARAKAENRNLSNLAETILKEAVAKAA